MNLMATIQKETIKVWFLLNQGEAPSKHIKDESDVAMNRSNF